MMELGTTSAKLKQAHGNPKNPQLSLHARYPIKSAWEFHLHNGEIIKGEVYCTDPLAGIVVIHDQLGEVRMVSVTTVKESNQLQEAPNEPIASSNVTHVKKILEEREKRAIRLAQESLRHINPKVRVCHVLFCFDFFENRVSSSFPSGVTERSDSL
jgi:hypothetical protein